MTSSAATSSAVLEEWSVDDARTLASARPSRSGRLPAVAAAALVIGASAALWVGIVAAVLAVV